MAAGKELSVSQAVPMRPEDRTAFRVAAAQLGVRPGLLGRVLITVGLEMLDSDRVKEVLQEELAAQDERHSAAGQAAMKARWHGTTEDGD